MSGYLLDTSVVSAFGPSGAKIAKPVAAWFEKQENLKALYLSSVVIAELESGTQRLRRLGSLERAEHLQRWLDRLIFQFSTRILAVDARVGRLAGKMADRAIAAGKHPGLGDVLIAATAGAYEMAILTVNARHFAVLDVAHFNPFVESRG
jgi:predicted nucleic acid-binding protein